jgi:hypothetical protein
VRLKPGRPITADILLGRVERYRVISIAISPRWVLGFWGFMRLLEVGMDSQRLRELLIKAVRELDQAEQDEILGELLTGASARLFTAMPGLTASMHRRMSGREQAELVDFTTAFLAGPGFGPGAPGALGSPGDVKLLPVRLPTADYERLRTWSREHNFSMAVIIRTLVERFLNEQDQRAA